MTREDVVAEALSWEGTPYHSRAQIKGVGVDCAQMPIATYAACGLMPAIAPVYAPDHMLHRDEEHFLGLVLTHAKREIERVEVQPGDLALFKFGRCYSHAAIVINLPEVLHAVIRGGAVIRADIDRDNDLADRPVRFFTMF